MVVRVMRTIKKSPETGRLNRAEVREFILSLRERREAAASSQPRPAGAMVVRERPLKPYGGAGHAADNGE
ncbi:MAG TPA: hypothetical protein VFX98_18885 [Longimicrobiaceae bacterium]|nr:hypothetical protein [Longimicrobiaceae bacterium]